MAVVVTAGHVDHGKSTLVRLLTGQEPDRWAEERRRGLTIDLGYAWTDIDGWRISLVDAPGHEHFTGNMLAGLGPVSAVMFVVAADDGWCPQSEEHARAIAALGIAHVLLVVTRCDLVPGGSAAREAAVRFDSLGVPVAETVLVSGATGEGLPELRAALRRLAAASHPGGAVAAVPAAAPTTADAATAEPPQDEAFVRLWVDRSFTIRGAGTVVTGTLETGTIRVGDSFALRDRQVTARGLQTCGEQVDTVTGPARVAVNLRGVEVAEVGRGVALLDTRWPRPVGVVDAGIRPVRDVGRGAVPEASPGAGDQAARRAEGVVSPRISRELMLHVGTASVPVRTQMLPDGRVRLRLTSRLPLRAGDRAALRDPGRHEMVAGIDILVVDPPTGRSRPPRAPSPAATAAATAAAGDPAAPAGSGPSTTAAPLRSLLLWLADHPLQAPTRDQLRAWSPTQEALASAVRAGVLLRLGDGIVLGRDAVAQASALLVEIAQPFTVGEATRAWGTSRRVSVPLLELLDARLVTRLEPDGRRRLRASPSWSHPRTGTTGGRPGA